MVCPGNANSVAHERIFLLKNATVNKNMGFDDVCNGKHVFVAFNYWLDGFGVNYYTGEMWGWSGLRYVSYTVLASEVEVQAAFFETYNITPIWLMAWDWGSYDSVTDQWTGHVGMIQRDEADYALDLSATIAKSKVAAFSPGTAYSPNRFLTRFPQELPPTWNLLGLFTKGYNSQRTFLINQFIIKKCVFYVFFNFCTQSLLSLHSSFKLS